MLRKTPLQNAITAFAISMMLCSCNSASNSNQRSEPQYPSFTYSKVGSALDNSYSVTDLFIVGNNVYLTLSDQDESTFGYAMVDKNSNLTTSYQTKYLVTPQNHQYSLIGNMVVNQDNGMLYVPAAYPSGDHYNYTWLKYESTATQSTDSVGDYAVTESLSSQFALTSASFFNDIIYANYAGTLIGFAENTSNKLFQDDKLLLSWQDAFAVDKEGLVAINEENNALVRISLDHKARTQIGESFSTLANRGFEAMPKFTIYNDTIYILAIHRNLNSKKPYISLCSISDTASDTTTWDCKVSPNSLKLGYQLINLDADKNTGKIYFVANNLVDGTQLYVVN